MALQVIERRMSTMRFRSEASEKTFRYIVASDAPDSISMDDLVEVYLKGKGEYVSRARNWKKSQQQKHNWRKFRHNYMTGIHRYLRSGSGQGSRVTIARSLAKSEVLENAGVRSVNLKLREYEIYDFLHSLALVRASLFEEATFFELEEQYIDYSLFVDSIVPHLNTVESCVIEGKPVPEESVEALLCIIYEEVFKKKDGEKVVIESILKPNEALVDLFHKLLSAV